MIRCKKIISIAMSMVVMATAFSTNVFACHNNRCCCPRPRPNITVEVNNGEINLPDNYSGEGEPIIRNGNADNVTTVNIGSRVSKLVGTFMDFKNLRNVNIPPDSSLIEIGANAFSGCTQLANIRIPNGVTSIGKEAFRDCTSLISIDIPDSVNKIDEDAFFNCKNLQTVNIGRKAINSFSDIFKNLNVETVNITSGITKIKEETFKDCKSLVTVNIPITVKAIGKRAFIGCDNLVNVNINPNINVKVSPAPAISEVGEMAFMACGSLTNVNIPTSITKINEFAFLGCVSLQQVDIPDNVKRIERYAFLGCTSLQEVYIPDNVGKIGSYAFLGCENLLNMSVTSDRIFDGFVLAGDLKVQVEQRNNVVQ